MKFAFLSKFGLECLTEPHEWNEETQQTIGQFISWEETYNFIPNVHEGREQPSCFVQNLIKD